MSFIYCMLSTHVLPLKVGLLVLHYIYFQYLKWRGDNADSSDVIILTGVFRKTTVYIFQLLYLLLFYIYVVL